MAPVQSSFSMRLGDFPWRAIDRLWGASFTLHRPYLGLALTLASTSKITLPDAVGNRLSDISQHTNSRRRYRMNRAEQHLQN